MTNRTQIDNAITQWGQADRASLPDWLRNPSTVCDEEFDIAMSVFLHREHPEVTPIYDGDDELIAWKGITLKSELREER